MKEFQLVEVEGYNNILFTTSFISPETLYKFKGGDSLAFYDVYELMPIVPPLEPILRGIYEKGELTPLTIDFDKKKISFSIQKDKLKIKNFCKILVSNIDELLTQLDICLLYYSIGLDLEEIKDKFMPIFKDDKEIIISNIYNDKKEKFSIHLKKYKGKVIFIVKKEII